jgi:glycosyltransferase involved in cell wall biosynthesis
MKYASIIVVHYSRTIENDDSFRRDEWLKKCIEALLKNTSYPAELIVMDNGGNPDDSDYLLSKAREGKLTHVRFPQNMHFAYAWNIGAKMATGEILCFVANDNEVHPNWLTECVRILDEHEGEKLVTTPSIQKDKARYTTYLPNGDRINPLSGSSCLVVRKQDFYAIGEWPIHHIGGTLWYETMLGKGYTTICTPKNMVNDHGWGKGARGLKIQVKKIVLNGEEVHFEQY